MNRAQRELAITFSTHSFPILILWFSSPGFIRSIFNSIDMLSRRFPFAIYYELEDEVAYVYAILDLRRDPLWIAQRLSESR
jgi:hypothetical protein